MRPPPGPALHAGAAGDRLRCRRPRLRAGGPDRRLAGDAAVPRRREVLDLDVPDRYAQGLRRASTSASAAAAGRGAAAVAPAERAAAPPRPRRPRSPSSSPTSAPWPSPATSSASRWTRPAQLLDLPAGHRQVPPAPRPRAAGRAIWKRGAVMSHEHDRIARRLRDEGRPRRRPTWRPRSWPGGAGATEAAPRGRGCARSPPGRRPRRRSPPVASASPSWAAPAARAARRARAPPRAPRRQRDS